MSKNAERISPKTGNFHRVVVFLSGFYGVEPTIAADVVLDLLQRRVFDWRLI